ncbi:hypothetical protein HYR69_03600 [Candidatus Sumerlaeota bacterium]|nr:hypothetical protein [Candidatus Sumerlaeota bacterium]
MVQQRVPHNLHIENFPAGFIGLMFSPSLGMLTMGPVTIFSFLGMVSALRPGWIPIEHRSDGSIIMRRPARDYFKRVMFLIVPFTWLHICVYSSYLEWWGGWSYCYRYLIDIQPFLALCTGWFFRPGVRWLKFRWPLYLPALLLGMAVQCYGAFFWNGANMKLSGMPRFYLNLDPARGYDAPFNHPWFFYSFKKQDHLILGELNGQFPSWETIKGSFATPGRIYQDLFVIKKWDDRTRGLIIIYYATVPKQPASGTRT